MKARIASAFVLVSLGLASCGGGEPKGQVVAKIGKDEITATDLQTELGNFRASDAKSRKLAEQQALRAIVERKVLAQAAREEKIDRTPEFALQNKRMEEALLVNSWQQRLARQVPAPSLEEAQKFISEHPDLYAARKLLMVDGLRFAAPRDQTLIAALQPLKTLDEVRTLLSSRHVAYTDGGGELDAFKVDPRLVEQLMKLGPDEVFVLPQGNAVLVGRIASVRISPVPNNLAVQHATDYLKATRTQEAVARRFGAAAAAGLKEVKYAKGYEPSKATPSKPAPHATPAKAATASKPAAES